MLVLSRKKSERIVIGSPPNAVTITVVKIGPNNVRLGIEAPDDMPINREEVALRIAAEASCEADLPGGIDRPATDLSKYMKAR